MSISDKTRKVLWGRSGNLCAFCRVRLVIDASAIDAESVVGDECHIISGAANGPRYEPHLEDRVDDINNLILLCRIHHKLVDDQSETFTADALRQLKENHEEWVRLRLSHTTEPEPVRIIRSPSEIPKQLLLVTSAKGMLDLALNCDGRYDDYPEDLSAEELEAVGSFLQNLTDWIDLGINEPYERIQAQTSIAETLSALDSAGLRVYAAREKQQLRGV